MTDERDDEIHADPPFSDEEGEKAEPRKIIYTDAAEAHENAEAPAPETFEAEVPDHEAAKLRIENKPEPELDQKSGKGKKGSTPEPPAPSTALVLTGAPEPEQLVLVRPMTRAEAEDYDKRITKAGQDLLKRQDTFRSIVLEFDTRRGWAQLGFKNVRDWGQARFGIEGKGIYAELTAARTEKVLTAVIEKENEEGREVPLPTKIPRDMLLAIKDTPAEKLPAVFEAAYTIAEEEAKEAGKDTKVVTTAKNVKEAINKLGLNKQSAKPEKPAKPAADTSGVGDFFGSFDPASNPPLPGTVEETNHEKLPEPTPPEPEAPKKPIPLPIDGAIEYNSATKIVSFVVTVKGDVYELRASKWDFPPSMFNVEDLFRTPSTAGKRKKPEPDTEPA